MAKRREVNMTLPHPNLSAGLNDALMASEGRRFVQINLQKKGTMIEVSTRNSSYTFVVVDPEKDEVALRTTSPGVEGIDIWTILGAGYGGSMTRIGTIEVGASIKMCRLSGGITETSDVSRFSVAKNTPNNKKVADKIVAEAESRRPHVMTEDERREFIGKAHEAIESMVTRDFPESFQAEVRHVIGAFGNLPAKGTALGVMSQAQKHGKLELALELLARDLKKHWLYQPPDVAGDPEFLPQNAHRWDALYNELGVPFPDHSQGQSNNPQV